MKGAWVRGVRRAHWVREERGSEKALCGLGWFGKASGPKERRLCGTCKAKLERWEVEMAKRNWPDDWGKLA